MLATGVLTIGSRPQVHPSGKPEQIGLGGQFNPFIDERPQRRGDAHKQVLGFSRLEANIPDSPSGIEVTETVKQVLAHPSSTTDPASAFVAATACHTIHLGA